MKDNPENHWTIDKRIPLVLVMGLVLQAVSIVWWASGVNYQQLDHSDRLTKLEVSSELSTVQRVRDREEITDIRADVRYMRIAIDEMRQSFRQYLREPVKEN